MSSTPAPEPVIIEADTPKLMEEFIRLPSALYKNDPQFVPPLLVDRRQFLDHKKNPFFSGARVKLFLARRGDETVGRIATCLYFAHNEIHNENVGFFGFFDTIDDEEVAHALLKVALITLKQEGVEVMRGPASLSMNHECGFLVDGYDTPPVIMMPYNRPYQVAFAESFGLHKVMDLFAYHISEEVGFPDRVFTLADKIAKRAGVTVRTLQMNRFDEEVKTIKSLYDRAWVDNWGFVPMTDAEFHHTAKQMKQIVDPKVALIAEVDDVAIGFSLSLPDINQALIHLDGTLFPTGIFKLLWHTKVRNKITGLRTLIMGVAPEYQKRGIDTLLHVKTYQNGIAQGYQHSELSWVLESNNLMRSVATSINAKAYKTYRMMEMSI